MKYQTPAFDYLLKTYGQAVKSNQKKNMPLVKIGRKHPSVRQDDGEVPSEDGEEEQQEEQGLTFVETVQLII